MTGPHPDTGANGVQPPDPQQLGAYFALMEAVSLLQHHVDQHLRTEGDLSYVQFQLLARLADAHGQLTMTQLADGVVYSRSGLTYQAGLLEKAGLITRAPSRIRRFIRDAKTGWASVGLAPITSMTSACSTEAKSWVPADVPNAWFRP